MGLQAQASRLLLSETPNGLWLERCSRSQRLADSACRPHAPYFISAPPSVTAGDLRRKLRSRSSVTDWRLQVAITRRSPQLLFCREQFHDGEAAARATRVTRHAWRARREPCSLCHYALLPACKLIRELATGNSHRGSVRFPVVSRAQRCLIEK